MTEESAASPRSVHITGYASHSISTDDTTAMIVFEVAGGKHFAITLPVEHLKAVRSGLSQLIDKVGARNGNALPKFPRELSVGFSDDPGNVVAPNGNAVRWRDCVIVRLDGGTDDEVMYVMSNKDGLTLSDNLKAGIMKRLTPAERRAWYEKSELKAPEKKIIMP